MKALQDLMYLVSRHKRKQLNVIGYNTADDRYELFYHKLERGEFDSDDEAAAYFFGKDKDGKFTQYKNFKNKFFRRLSYAAFHLDLQKPEFNNAQVGFYNCWKNLALVKIIGVHSSHTAVKKIMLKTLPAAIKYDVTEVVLEMSRLLFFHYTAREPDNNKRNYYKELVIKSLKELEVVVKAEMMYVDIIHPFVFSRSSKPWVAEQARKYINELDLSFGKVESYRFYLYYFMIKSLEKEILYDYPGVVMVCKEALSHFGEKDSTPKTTFAIFGNRLQIALTMVGEYEEAEGIAKRSIAMVDRESVGWYKTNEMYMALKFYKKDYQQAYNILKEAISSQRFNTLPPSERESWKIYERYIHLLIAAGKIELTDAEKEKNKFRPFRFLNEVPNFSKDKRGMNIPALIIHAIYLLYEKRFDESYDRMLALQKYNDRHLKEGDDTFRTWCFVEALLRIKVADFKKEDAEKRAAQFLGRMSTQPVQYLNAPHEVEVIPYEHLWELAMEAL